jgi:transcriptional regulator with XRE-family HTH domain
MSINLESIGRLITQLRRRDYPSMTSFARFTGLSRNFLYRLEAGDIPNPSLRPLNTIARALGISLLDLIGAGLRRPTRRRARARGGRG